ncbi:TonB-dependent receptor domain-containing protein [Sulfurimonas sp.]
MKKTITLSLLVFSSLYASEIELSPLSVESTIITEVAQNAQTSADVAQALSDSVPSIDMIRRSAIANDILIRGQKRDNISVEVDGTKVYGACPNRMDPPVSHIVANQIDTVEVIEGPYDVENFETLSGGLKITTKKPSKKLQGSLNLGFGAWNYKKFGATVSGGNDIVRMLVTASTESADQYHDGNSDTLSQQIDKYILQNPTVAGTAYQPQYKDLPAYKKKSVMAKAYVSTAKNQELRLSVTANRSDDILYPNSKMDAAYDDSNIYSVAYNIDNISQNYKNVNLQYYYSNVDHPMSTYYRVSSGLDSVNSVTNHLTTSMRGLKLKNTIELQNYKLLLGLDSSKRSWDGKYYKTLTGLPLPAGNSKSIDNAVTKNHAIFAKLTKDFGPLNVSVGGRYDATSISQAVLSTNTYYGLGANILATYNINKENKFFAGIGQAYRVPDARELYFVSSTGNFVGTPNLKQTKNKEVDIGYETNNAFFKFKIKGFYSRLTDYIYIEKGVAVNAFSNINAKIYGGEASASIYATDDITIDINAAYKRGKKDEPLAGQTNTNLADIAPLEGKIAINYEYTNNSLATLETRMRKRWTQIDSDNGEQVLAGWAILNAKVKHAVNKKFDFTLGMNNILNKTYAVSNTYADLVLITAGGTSDIMLLNEPGRYFYTNLDFKF